MHSITPTYTLCTLCAHHTQRLLMAGVVRRVERGYRNCQETSGSPCAPFFWNLRSYIDIMFVCAEVLERFDRGLPKNQSGNTCLTQDSAAADKPVYTFLIQRPLTGIKVSRYRGTRSCLQVHPCLKFGFMVVLIRCKLWPVAQPTLASRKPLVCSCVLSVC